MFTGFELKVEIEDDKKMINLFVLIKIGRHNIRENKAPDIAMGKDILFSHIAIFIFINDHMHVALKTENHITVTLNGD